LLRGAGIPGRGHCYPLGTDLRRTGQRHRRGPILEGAGRIEGIALYREMGTTEDCPQALGTEQGRAPTTSGGRGALGGRASRFS
jgi:hypothetical protein